MRSIFRADTERLTKLWDSGLLVDCYCLIFSNVWGFRIVWNNEDGQPLSLDNNSKILQGYFIVLAIYETEEQARKHFQDFIKYEIQ